MPRTDTRPNVLLVQTDQQRWDTVGAYGNPSNLTPTLDALAQDGVLFRQAFTPQPLCGPARSVLQTGQFATRHDIYLDFSTLPANTRTVAHEFRDAGYETGFVGDWHLAGTFDAPIPPEHRGGYDDYWIAADVPEFTTHPDEGTLYDSDGDAVEFSTYRTDAFTSFALEGINRLAEPFFLVISFLEPHDQNDEGTFVAPDGYAERYARDPYVPPDLQNRPGNWYAELPDYYGMVRRIDECIGRLLDALDGLERDTVTCFTADHGCHFGTRPGEHKRSPHESSIRIPLLFGGPGFDHAGTVERPVSLVDVAPTLLDAAGVDVPDRMDGHRLLPLLDGDSDARPEEVFVQTSEAEIGRSIRTERWKYAVAAPTMAGWRGGNADSHSDLYVGRYLYDLKGDPEERVNLIGRGDYREIAADLRERLRKRIVDAGEPEPELRPFEDPGYPDF